MTTSEERADGVLDELSDLREEIETVTANLGQLSVDDQLAALEALQGKVANAMTEIDSEKQ